MSALVVLGMLLLVNILAVAHAIFTRSKPFDRRVAGIRVTVDPKTNTVTCHTAPTRAQLAEIDAWAGRPKSLRNDFGWHVVEPL